MTIVIGCRYNSNDNRQQLKRQLSVCDNGGVDTTWLDEDESAAWVRLAAVVELLPGVLDSQLRHDAELTHFEYFVLAMLSQAPRRTLRMTALAAQTNATLPRLSHVVRRLEDRGLVDGFPVPRTRGQPTHADGRRLAEGARAPRGMSTTFATT